MALEALRPALAKLYGDSPEGIDRQFRRYSELGQQFARHFPGGAEPRFFSSPGRTEISGNHTDHNGGKVLAASINLDSLAAAAPTADATLTLQSEGYGRPIVARLDDLAPLPIPKGAPDAEKRLPRAQNLLRGIAKGFLDRGLKVGGFSACMTSTVAEGSGLSSSASVEMLIGAILNHFYNNDRVDTAARAQIGKFTENAYWDKPSGLLDQMACGTGGMVYMDFFDPASPKVRRVNFDFSKAGYRLLVVNTGGDHADLTPLYAAIHDEMVAVAEALGTKRLADVTRAQVVADLPRLRKKAGDRAILRALHFFAENARVDEQRRRLEAGDFGSFLRLVSESGSSSWRLLQNCYDPRQSRQQEIPLALALAEQFVSERQVAGAYRVHGGGFGGTVLVMLPAASADEFAREIAPVFGPSAASVLSIRNDGAVAVETVK